MLVWIDLETTGLDPMKDEILEVGAIVTDDNFNEVARYSAVAYFYHARTIVHTFAGLEALGRDKDSDEYKSTIAALARKTDIVPYVLEMHWRNGLWKDCAKSEKGLVTVDEELAAFIRTHAQWSEPKKDKPEEMYLHKPPLAGSTIDYDRSMMRGRGSTMPDSSLQRALAELHYRSINVSSFNEVAERQWKTLYDARPNNKDKAHRGMADIEESIRVLKHYVANLLPAVPDVVLT
jgi:oligoribonuclease